MTRKDYVKFAELMHTEQPARGHVAYPYWLRTCRRLADIFRADNPRFDSTRFFTACGVDD